MVIQLVLCFFILTTIMSCESNKHVSSNDISKLKADHETKLRLMRVAPDPLSPLIPDSMKKWNQIFRNVMADDQKHRIPGYENLSTEEIREQRYLDSQNLVLVSNFLDTYGWPAGKEIGFIGQKAIGMVVQHAPLKIQEKYYPLLMQTFSRDSGLRESVALMTDRIKMKKREFQVYGTQFVRYKGKYVLFPVYEVDSMEVRRQRLGLKNTFDEYVRLFGVIWDKEKYKKQLPGLIKYFKLTE